MYDVIIIGAGISGTSIMRELSKYDLTIVTVDKANDVSVGTTKANSALIHAGYDAPYGTNKAKFNVEGNRIYGEICDELNVPFERIGSYVLGFDEKDLAVLEDLLDNGKKLNIPELRIIETDEILAHEPNINSNVKYALYAPTAGIVEPWELAIAYAENAMDNGAELKLNFEVTAIEQDSDHFEVRSDNQTLKTKMIVNCAGVYADDMYNMVTDNDEFTIHPRRGEYYLLDKTTNGFINTILFQTPTEISKGVLMAPTVDGNVLVGPNAEDLSMDQKDNKDTTKSGLDYVKKTAMKTSDQIPFRENIRVFAGLRAEPDTGDFIVEESPKVKNFYNVAGIKSPGLSSAPAIAKYIEKLIVEKLGDIEPTADYNPNRRARIKFHELSQEEKNELIKKDPKYGKVICRCEYITEAEIVDAIHRNCGGRTINGIKRRVRPGAGRCQGGFCGPRVLEILSRELGLDETEIVLENPGSNLLVEETKA
jgi:glycerol-3-phosphate dehydrogenase